MAEDDDDDSFGDFITSNHATVNSSSQISSTSDDWVDFNLVQNNTANHNAKSQAQPSPQAQPQWEKIRGALPLSLFGEEEEEDEKPVVSSDGDGVKQSSFAGNGGFKPDNNSNKNVNNNAHLGIDDLIANLYGQRSLEQIIKTDGNVNHGNGLNFNSVNSSVPNDSLSKSDAVGSSSLNTVAVEDVDQESDDEGGWEFRDAYSGSNNPLNGNNNKEHSKDIVSPLAPRNGSHEPLDLFATSNNGVSFAKDSSFVSKPVAKVQNGFNMDFYTDQKSTTHGINSNTLGGRDDRNNDFGEFAFENQSLKHKEPCKGNFLLEFDTGFDIKPSTLIPSGFDTEYNFQTGRKDIGGSSSTHSLPVIADSDKRNGKLDFGHQKAFSEENIFQLGSHDNSEGPIDLFAFSNGVPDKSHQRDNGFDFSQTSVQNGFTIDPNCQTERKDMKDSFDSQPPGTSFDPDENFGGFETAFSEAGPKSEGNEASQKKYKEPVPLSIFGIEEPEPDNSLKLQDEFLFKPSPQVKKKPNHSSKFSIEDLSDLYSQAEPIRPVFNEDNKAGKENLFQSTNGEHSSHIVDDDDNFDDGSWEFKVAFSSGVENQNLSFDKKLKNCIDFYSKLKDELCVVARYHLQSLKKAKNDAALAGEETRVAALDKEIQEASEELDQEIIISTEAQLDDHSERVICLEQYIMTLHEPNFHVLDSEYHISRRLSSAESDLGVAVVLIKHLTMMLKILTLAVKDEPASYVSMWHKMILVCAQELKHGDWIWKQSLEKNVRSEILSEPQGERFIKALGEIYRAVVIIGASVKFYKPWILLSSADLAEIYALLEECHSLWSKSDLEEALPVRSLLESIRHIQDLDEAALANESHEESLCQLSLLPQGILPEMNMVVWNGDKYFLTLANLWANLISSNPPKPKPNHVS